jgi:hypothetical protein
MRYGVLVAVCARVATCTWIAEVVPLEAVAIPAPLIAAEADHV